jgi:hypothetical protein
MVIRQSGQKSLILPNQLLFNTTLQYFFFGLWSSGSSPSDEITVTLESLPAVPSVAVSASRFDLHSIVDLSLLPSDALGDALSRDSLRVESEDALLTRLLQLGSACSCLLCPSGLGCSSGKPFGFCRPFADFG